MPLFVFLLFTHGLRAEFGQLALYFAQVVIGAGTSTSFSIHNPTSEVIDVRVEIRGSDGMKVLEFDPLVEIPAGGTKNVSLTGGDELVAGRAKLSSSARFNATEFYQIVVGDVELPRVGVPPSLLVTKSKIFAFVIGSETNTGVAVANPNEGKEIVITARRIGADGTLLETVQVSLPALTQLPAFLDQAPFFPGLADFEGLGEFESDDSFILVTLRSDNDLLAAVSALTPEGAGQLAPGSVTTAILADEAVTNSKLGEGAVTEEKIAGGQVVKSLNGLTDEVTLTAGNNIGIEVDGSEITVSAASPIQQVNNTDGSLVITDPIGPDVKIGVAAGGIGTAQLADGAVTAEKLGTIIVSDGAWSVSPTAIYAPDRDAGIGTSNPTSRLDVRGDVYLGGDVQLAPDLSASPSFLRNRSITVRPAAGRSGGLGTSLKIRAGDASNPFNSESASGGALLLEAADGKGEFATGGGVHIRSGATSGDGFSARGGDITFTTGGINDSFVQRMRILSGGIITLGGLGESEKVVMFVRGELNTDDHFIAPRETDYRFPTRRYNLVIDRNEARTTICGFEDRCFEGNLWGLAIRVTTDHVIRKISLRISRLSGCDSGGSTRVGLEEYDFDANSKEIGPQTIDSNQLVVLDGLAIKVKDRHSYRLFAHALDDGGGSDGNCKLAFRGALVEVETDRFSLGGTQ